MRIIQMMFVVALVLVLAFTFVLNERLDAGTRETARLEKKLETALKDIDRLENDIAAARKRDKEMVADLKELTRALKSLDKKVSALGDFQLQETDKLKKDLYRSVREQKTADKLLVDMVKSVWKLDSKVAALEGRTLRVEAHTHTVVGSPLHRKAYPCFPNELCP